ncbi:MAG: PAS domain S-box protein [Verrucomicrobiota bacterium]
MAVYLEQAAQAAGNDPPGLPEDARQILHELQVHQIELEMQNKELLLTQAELDASRTRYFELYDQAPVGYLTVSESGLILEANLTASGLLDGSRGALVKQPLPRFIVPEDQDIYYIHLRRLHESGPPQMCELRMLGRDGKPFWAQLDTTATHPAHGPQEFRLVLSDISARKRADGEIRQLNAELELRVAARTAQLQAANALLTDYKAALDEHTVVAITDASGKITDANDNFCAIYQHSREELIGQDHRIIASGYHSQAFMRDLWQTIISGRVWKGEMQNRAKDGSLYWMDCTIVPFLGPDGTPYQYMAVCTNVTERRRTEEALRESEERVRLATEAAGIGVWERDLKSEALLWNDRMFAIYGLPDTPDGKIFYQDWRARVLPEDLPEQEERLRHTIETCGRDQREFQIVRASDHAVRVIHAAERVIAGADGQPVRMVGINLDITERKHAELEIGKLSADLLTRAAELEASNRELEAFSYSISHDLRSPLRAVDGFSRMVLKDCAEQLDAQGQRMLGVIRSETQRMGQLIDDLLAFSRLGRQPIEQKRIEMDALAKQVFDELSALEPARKLRLTLHPLPSACGTRAMILQVWVNLISNAIKFTKERELGEIEIGAQDGEDGAPVYYVRDNGAGFDMQYANKLFGVFERLHSQSEFPGTGVGLALVQRILHRHGGRVWAQAAVNQGATFFFTLPHPPHEHRTENASR